MPSKQIHLLLVIFALLALTPVFAFSANFVFGYIDGLSLENQAISFPIIQAQSYLLAIYFAFGKHNFVVRSTTLLIGLILITFEATWIHATLMDLSEPRYYASHLQQNLIVFIVPSAFYSVLFLPLRTRLTGRVHREQFTILQLLFLTLLGAMIIANIRHNPFAHYLFKWSALGEMTVSCGLLTLFLYAFFLGDSVFQKLLGLACVITIFGYIIRNLGSSPSVWDYTNVLLPWLLYVPALFALRHCFATKKHITIATEGITSGIYGLGTTPK